jgi:hypothetical protein
MYQVETGDSVAHLTVPGPSAAIRFLPDFAPSGAGEHYALAELGGGALPSACYGVCSDDKDGWVGLQQFRNLSSSWEVHLVLVFIYAVVTY